MLLVPGAIIALIGAHMYLVVKLGTTAPPWVRAERPKGAMPTSELEAGANGNGRVNGAPLSGEGNGASA
jgi:quinol-cytochrome oxidoreductase complex cytochrome b subunit